jgi:glycosyltransferase involved in cell wall biosynthesis
MKQPWLSVVMPTYNGAAYLAAALDSIAAQHDNDIEILAIDDGSTDETLALLRHYAKKLPLRIMERGRVGNWVANTNYGLSLACGEYVCYLHQDDCWLPGRLAALKAQVVHHPSVVFFLHASIFIDARGKRLGVWRCPLPHTSRPLSTELLRERLLIQNFIAIPAPLFRRESALSVGGMDERLWYTADWELWLKLAAAGTTFYDPQPRACFRIHPQSQTIRQSTADEEFLWQYQAILQRHLPPWRQKNAVLHSALQATAEFSAQVNIALARSFHRHKPNWNALLRQGGALGLAGWHRFLRDSRIVERLLARLWVYAQAARRNHYTPFPI